MLALPTRSSGGRRTHSSEWEGTQTLRRERHDHRWPSKVRGAMLTLPTRLRREPHAHRWPSNVRGAMLALPTRRAIKQEGTKRPKNQRLLNDSFGEQRTQLSAWEGTQTLRRVWHAHRWPSQLREAMLARPTRRATYHRALGSGELIPQNERELRRSEGRK